MSVHVNDDYKEEGKGVVVEEIEKPCAELRAKHRGEFYELLILGQERIEVHKNGSEIVTSPQSPTR
jgi:hypothetical protein